MIRVLVVDDSAFARKVIREILSGDPGISVVGIARDGLDALEKIAELRPDVVTLDLVMPELDGLGVLRALPKSISPRVVIVSVSGSETELAIEALQSGAVDIVTKPTTMATDRLYELSAELIAKVKAAASARILSAEASPLATSSELQQKLARLKASSVTTRLLVVGTSTGGPQALTHLFKALPPGLPFPIAVALHIPAGYTAPLAARISLASAVPIREAEDGQELRAGTAVIAPGGMHLSIRAEGGRLFARVSRMPLDTLHHPSVDVLFESAAKEVGSGAIGLVMTGMGNDGQKGAAAIRGAGGRVLAESESSCVVYGMPRSVIEAGLASGEAPLENLGGLLLDHITG